MNYLINNVNFKKYGIDTMILNTFQLLGNNKDDIRNILNYLFDDKGRPEEEEDLLIEFDDYIVNKYLSAEEYINRIEYMTYLPNNSIIFTIDKK